MRKQWLYPNPFKIWVSPPKGRRVAWGLGRNRPNARSALNVLCCIVVLSATACQQAKEIRGRIVHKLDTALPYTQDGPAMMEGSAYYAFPEISPGKHYNSETTFCYKMQTDILCYDQPRPGWEDRMVGYQEPLKPVLSQSHSPAISVVENSHYSETLPPAAPVQQAPLEPLSSPQRVM